MAQGDWHKIKSARQRLVLCRLMIDIMRTVHGAYAPVSEPFGTRLETFFVGLCVAVGDVDDKPFTVAKIAAYMRVPRTTVIRRLNQLHRRDRSRAVLDELLARHCASVSHWLLPAPGEADRMKGMQRSRRQSCGKLRLAALTRGRPCKLISPAALNALPWAHLRHGAAFRVKSEMR